MMKQNNKQNPQKTQTAAVLEDQERKHQEYWETEYS